MVTDVADAMASADVAAVLLRLADADERSLINRVKELAPAVQDRDVALVLDDRADIVARSGADGAHLGGVAALKEAVSRAQAERISPAPAGCHTRHDAMLAAEAGADYVMFGEPGRRRPAPFLRGRDRPGRMVGRGVRDPLRRAMPRSSTRVAALAAAGADFVAVGEAVFDDPRGPAAAIAEAAARLAGGARMTHAARLPNDVDRGRAPAGGARDMPRRREPAQPAPKPAAPPAKPAAPAAKTNPLPPPKANRPPAAAAATPANPAARPGVEPDLAYGAYQRGYFLTAFAEATRRVDQKGDPTRDDAARRALCERRRHPPDDVKAVEWYRLAAERGDRDAMFALGHVPHDESRRAARQGGSGAAVRRRRQARPCGRGL